MLRQTFQLTFGAEEMPITWGLPKWGQTEAVFQLL